MWSVLYLYQLFLYLLMGRLFLTDFPGKLIQLVYPIQVIDHAGNPACLGADPEISSIYGGNDTGGNRKYICPLRPVCQADPADGILHPSYLCATDQQLFTNRHSTI